MSITQLHSLTHVAPGCDCRCSDNWLVHHSVSPKFLVRWQKWQSGRVAVTTLYYLAETAESCNMLSTTQPVPVLNHEANPVRK